ncbi:MAG: NAD(P)H-hydrate dehydratase [Armatimonadetes bacterium]|nr:NAD(P)H-hydrate dehydratase [Armatimonadota bacterium]
MRKPILTAAQMRAADLAAIGQHGIPSLVLMENAARGVMDALVSQYGPVSGKRILVVCGKGNNGGDGLAIARLANIGGAVATAVLLFPPEQLSPDAVTQLSILNSFAPNQVIAWEDERWRELKPEIIVDAVLGTGSTGALRPPISDAVEWMNQQCQPVVAVDLPTGIDADTGKAATTAVRADSTVTLGAWKPGLLLQDGPDHAGTVTVAHIGAPNAIYANSRLALLNGELAAELLPPIARNRHKYQRGNVMVVAGARGMLGAGILSATAALRAGSGLSVVAMPEQAAATMPHALPAEIMTRLLPSDPNGAFDGATAAEVVLHELPRFASVAVGPGVSRSESAAEFVRQIIEHSPIPTVLDADGLNAFAGKASQLANRNAPLVITPHHGEMARLLGIEREAVAGNPVAIANQAAAETSAIVVLKGAPTVIASPDGNGWILQAGNPGMATAGSGDVLTGVLASLVAQCGDPLAGTLLGVYLHSHAGDFAAATVGQRSMVAGDIITHLSQAYATLQ